MRPTAAPSKTKRQSTLPKNGEFRRHSVGFCRLALCNIVLSWPLPTLTAVVSIKSIVPRGTNIAGMRVALCLLTYKIGFPGWPESNLDSVTGFGASITRRGLAPAPFFISSVPQRTVRSATVRTNRGWPVLAASGPRPPSAQASSAFNETDPQPRRQVLPVRGNGVAGHLKK